MPKTNASKIVRRKKAINLIIKKARRMGIYGYFKVFYNGKDIMSGDKLPERVIMRLIKIWKNH